MKKIKVVLVFMLFSMMITGVKAQYTGPGSEIKLYTIEEVKDDAMKLDRKDIMVKLKGYIVEKINEEDYVFQDKTGKIQLEIEEEYLPNFPFNNKTEVIITAEVDYDLLNGTELEVERIIERASDPVERPIEPSPEN